MLENALFEEEQSQVQKSRKIYETLIQDVAVGHIKSTIFYAAFERRMNNNEKAKDLYLKAFETALAKEDARAVTYVSMIYARFVAFECNDVERACQVMQQARLKIKNSKVLYLSQINLMKHIQACGMFAQLDISSKSKKENRVAACYEAALFTSTLT